MQVTKEQRDHAKQLTYGLLYGMGPAKLADELGCSVGEAKDAQVGGWVGGRALGRLGAACLCQQSRMQRATATFAQPSPLPVAPDALIFSVCLQDKFRRGLPGIEAWQARVVADCRRLGYVEVRRQRLAAAVAAAAISGSHY
jgi:hypothetical protein